MTRCLSSVHKDAETNNSVNSTFVINFIQIIIHTRYNNTCQVHLQYLVSNFYGVNFYIYKIISAYRNSWALDAIVEPWTLDPGLWTLDSGRWALDAGLWTVDSGRWTVDSGRWTLDAGLWTLGSGRWTLDSGPWTLDSQRWTLDAGRWMLNFGRWALGTGHYRWLF